MGQGYVEDFVRLIAAMSFKVDTPNNGIASYKLFGCLQRMSCAQTATTAHFIVHKSTLSNVDTHAE